MHHLETLINFRYYKVRHSLTISHPDPHDSFIPAEGGDIMKRVSGKATKSVSHSGSKKTVMVRVSNGTKAVTRKVTFKTK